MVVQLLLELLWLHMSCAGAQAAQHGQADGRGAAGSYRRAAGAHLPHRQALASLWCDAGPAACISRSPGQAHTVSHMYSSIK